jgi:hypothetical protein
MFYPGCPLCQGALAALLSVIIGPTGAAVARRDPICMGLFLVWSPLAGLQALGHYQREWKIIQLLHLDQLFMPAWLHAVFGLVLFFRVIAAWRQGRIDKSSAAAKAIAEAT